MKRPFTVARVPQSLMLIPLAPVLAVQAWRTVRRTPRLDPATGDEHGFVPGKDPGSGPVFRVVVIGESTAVGVGASQHAEALPGFLAEALRERLRRSVAWSVSGENGATARRITSGLVPPANGSAPDLVVVTVGINDLIKRRPLRRWTADMTDLIAVLHGRYAHATLVVAGMPPVHRFPAIPQPLRLFLGARARTMDRIMRDAAQAGGALHIPMDEAMARDRRLFASDGFHPSPAGYRAWAKDLAHAANPVANPVANPAAANPAPADPADPTPADPARAADAARAAASALDADADHSAHAEHAGGAEPAGSAKPAGGAEPAPEPAAAEPARTAAPALDADDSAHAEPGGGAEPAGSAKPAWSAKPAGGAEPAAESIGAVPADAVDAAHAGRAESVDAAYAESAGGAEPADVEPVRAAHVADPVHGELVDAEAPGVADCAGAGEVNGGLSGSGGSSAEGAGVSGDVGDSAELPGSGAAESTPPAAEIVQPRAVN